MPIPDYQSLMLPILQLASDGAEHRTYAVKRIDNDFFDEDEV